MNLRFLILFVVTSAVAWWLSGYDSQLSGDNKPADFKRRLIRCALTMLLIGLGIGASLAGGRIGGFVFIAIIFPMALIWAGCGSELLARGFHHLIDSPDTREYDPKKLAAELDRLASLFGQGRNEEAIELATRLVKAGDASSLAMETMLFNLYEQAFGDERLLLSPALAEADKLCEESRFAEAESQLNLLLQREPRNLASRMMLLRLYARNSRNPEKATALLRDLERRSRVPPFFVDYARQRVNEWLAPRPQMKKSTEGIESLLVDRRHVRGPEQSPPSVKPTAD